MTVAANCKQVLTIAIAVFLFNLHINFTNGIGIVLTLIGGVSTDFSILHVFSLIESLFLVARVGTDGSSSRKRTPKAGFNNV